MHVNLLHTDLKVLVQGNTLIKLFTQLLLSHDPNCDGINSVGFYIINEESALGFLINTICSRPQLSYQGYDADPYEWSQISSSCSFFSPQSK